MGFENASGQEVTFQTTAPALPQPSAELVGPRSNGSIGVGTLNGEGYVDVTFPNNPYKMGDPAATTFSGTLNASSVTSTSPAIQINDPSGSNVAIDTSQAPLQMSAFEFRYWLTGVQQSDETGLTAADIDFIQNRVSYTDASGNLIFNAYGLDPDNPTVQTDNVLPLSPTTIQLVHAAVIDLRVYPSVGAQLGTANLTAITKLGGKAIQVSGPDGSIMPTGATLLADNVTVRYYLPPDTSFTSGQYTVCVVANKWGDSLSTSPNNLGAMYTFSAVNVIAQVAGPFTPPPTGSTTSSIDVGVLNAATFATTSPYTQAPAALPYIDVRLPAGAGAQLNYTSILGAYSAPPQTGQDGSRAAPMSAPFTATFDPVNGGPSVTLMFDAEPVPITMTPNSDGTMSPVPVTDNGDLPDDTTLQTDAVSVFRYFITNPNFTYSPGTVTFNFTQGAWSDSQNDPGQPGTMTFDILGPTATISNPSSGGSIDFSALNNRHYIDLTLPIPANLPTGYTIDQNSVTTLTPKFTFSGTGVGTAAVDTSQAPVFLGSNRYRFFITGTFSSNDVTVNFIPGSYSFVPSGYTPAAVSTATVSTASTASSSTTGVLTITFPGPPASPSGLAIDPNSIIRNAQNAITDPISLVTVSGETVTLITSQAPTEVGTSNEFLFPVTLSPALTGSVSATVSFNANAWSFTDASGTYNSVSLAAATVTPLDTNGVTYVDVTFTPAVGETLDTSTITGGQFTLTGSAVAASVPNNPLMLGTSSAGTTFRFFVNATFQTGTVTASLRRARSATADRPLMKPSARPGRSRSLGPRPTW